MVNALNTRNAAKSIGGKISESNPVVITKIPQYNYCVMLRYVPWDIWLGNSRNHEYMGN